MTHEQKNVMEWMKAFGQETPEKPCIPSEEVRRLRAKLILEEALETIKALGFYVGDFYENKDGTHKVHLCAAELLPNLTEIADGCEDLKVVTEGTLVACGLTNNKHGYQLDYNGEDPLFNEVMRSNWTKLWTDGEVRNHFKPEEWSPKLEVCAEEGKYFARKIYNSQDNTRAWLVKDKDGKVIKSPSYSPPNLTQWISPKA